MAEQNAMLTGRIVPEASLEGSVNMPQFVGGGGVTEEKDPTVPAWAKQPEKPVYTADEVGAISQDQLGHAVNQALLEAKETGEFDGAPGNDGFSPVAKVEQASDGAVISITDKEGTTEATISNGKDGNPGVYIGSGEMPEGYNVQIDPNGDAFTVDDLITSPMVGATATAAGKAGLVPAPAAGDNGKFLRGDGTWGEIAIPEGGGGAGEWVEFSRGEITEDVGELEFTGVDDYTDFLLIGDFAGGNTSGVFIRINGKVVSTQQGAYFVHNHRKFNVTRLEIDKPRGYYRLSSTSQSYGQQYNQDVVSAHIYGQTLTNGENVTSFSLKLESGKYIKAGSSYTLYAR